MEEKILDTAHPTQMVATDAFSLTSHRRADHPRRAPDAFISTSTPRIISGRGGEHQQPVFPTESTSDRGFLPDLMPEAFFGKDIVMGHSQGHTEPTACGTAAMCGAHQTKPPPEALQQLF